MTPAVGYTEMKDSGIPWIGQIPKEWKVQKLFRCFGLIGSGTTPKSQVEDYYNGNIPWLQSGDINGGIVKSTAKSIKEIALTECSALRMYNAPFIAVAMYGASIANTSIVAIDACTNQACCVLSSPQNGIDYKFVFYAILSAKEELLLCARGGTQPNISQEILKQFRLPLPSLQEQTAIAAYLDTQCAKIDEIIAEAKASIEDYKQWKASIIYEAVTKGLDPDAEMKDSGIEWIGEIPKEWRVCKTLHALSMPITDGPHTTPELFDDGVPFISAEAVSCGNGYIDFSHKRGFVSEEFYQECCKKYIPQIDDIYMIKSGATTGRVAIVDTGERFTIWSPLAVFRANNKRMLPRYLFYFVQSDAYQKQVAYGWTYGTQQNIGMRTLETLKLCLPPIYVQKYISDFLDRNCTTIDKLVVEKQALIADLETYKKSLIYEVVTGKRRVC